MFWLQLAAALGRGAAEGTTGAVPAGEILILYQDKGYEVAYLGNRSIAEPTGGKTSWYPCR
jgi:hypothetical protein